MVCIGICKNKCLLFTEIPNFFQHFARCSISYIPYKIALRNITNISIVMSLPRLSLGYLWCFWQVPHVYQLQNDGAIYGTMWRTYTMLWKCVSVFDLCLFHVSKGSSPMRSSSEPHHITRVISSAPHTKTHHITVTSHGRYAVSFTVGSTTYSG